MKQMVINGATPFLPEEIMTNILKRLPVKSLMRFQCVCKHWKDLFKTPSFVADHLHHSTHHNTSLLLFQSSGADPFQLRLLDGELQLRDFQTDPPFDSLPRDSVNIIGSSNGLLCVAIDQTYRSIPILLLWNPATRDIRKVPISRTIPVNSCFLGFAFSTSLNDYKIVSIYDDSDGMIYKAEVYSLSRDSWKEIEVENLDYVSVHIMRAVSTSGAIFWYGITPGEKEEEEEEEEEEEDVYVDELPVIVSFDMVMEVFTVLPFLTNTNPNFNLTVYEDKLAMVIENVESIYLWAMEIDSDSSDDIGEIWSWTEKFTRGTDTLVMEPGIVWKDEIVMSVESGLCMFNMTANKCKSLAVPQHDLQCHFLNYVESLVPVVNIHNIDEEP